MRVLRIAVWSVAASLLIAGAASADVQLSIVDGRVSLVARNATVGQILAEWARIGQTKIVNGERVPGGPVTLELQGVPEAEALDTILRSASGFMAAPRANPVPNASRFDRIVVMPTSVAPPAAPARAGGAPPPVFPQPGFQPTQIPVPGAEEDAEGERPGPARPPVFNTFPPQQAPGQVISSNPGVVPPVPYSVPQQPQSGTTATSPFMGVSTPGMIVQPPQQQPNQPLGPGQVRRPGGPEQKN